MRGKGGSCDVDRVFFEPPGLLDARYDLDDGPGSGGHRIVPHPISRLLSDKNNYKERV
jgi:hypothetical protein